MASDPSYYTRQDNVATWAGALVLVMWMIALALIMLHMESKESAAVVMIFDSL